MTAYGFNQARPTGPERLFQFVFDPVNFDSVKAIELIRKYQLTVKEQHDHVFILAGTMANASRLKWCQSEGFKDSVPDPKGIRKGAARTEGPKIKNWDVLDIPVQTAVPTGYAWVGHE